MKDKKKILMGLGVVSIIVLTLGLTYAFFNYSRSGSTENSITLGAITFIYEEIDQQGAGISIENAVPIEDSVGKQGQAFNFKIKSSNSMNAPIPYQITARKNTKISNPLPDEAVKIYLTKVDANTNNETEVLLDNYSNLITLEYNNHDDEILWTDQVAANDTSYEQNYKLRMWIDSDTDFSTGNYNNKEFSITVNVYGGTAKQNEPDAPEITSLTSTTGTVSEVVDETLGYDYITSELPNGTTSLALNVTTEDANDTVTAERIDGIALSNEKANIQRLSTVHNVALTNLTSGDNYFKITVKAHSKKKIEKIIKVVVAKSNDASLSSLSISDCPLNETFSSITTSYTCSTNKKNLTVTPESENHATWQITGNSGLQTGENTITILVTAEDGVTQKTYTVTATKAEILVFDTDTQVNDNIEISYSGTYKKVEFKKAGTYKIELWGAQGGHNSSLKSNGGYVSGSINLSNSIDLYVYIGEQGVKLPKTSVVTFNGGGFGGKYSKLGKSGGGATDIRYFSSTPSSEDLAWDSILGLNSRIMVAGAGGGAGGEVVYENTQTSAAGGLIGHKGTYYNGHGDLNQYGLGGTQISGGNVGQDIKGGSSAPAYGGYSSSFGKGGAPSSYSANYGAGGGGSGYYGGGAGGATGSGGNGNGGAGGSSFISGHQGCLAIAQGSTSEPRALKDGCSSSSTSVECSTHYSGLSFTNTNMIDGVGHTWTTQDDGVVSTNLMPNPAGGYYEEGLGHSGNGFARITYLGN